MVLFSSSSRKLITKASNILSKTPVNLSFKVIGVGADSETPIFVLHELLASKRHWKGIGKTIHNITKKTVVVVDARNHGGSPHINSNRYEDMASDLILLLDRLEVKKASLLGHCFGGRIAMCTSFMAPERVAGLIIVDISPVSNSDQMKNTLTILQAIKKVDFKNAKTKSQAEVEAKKQLKEVVTEDIMMRRILSGIKIKGDGAFGWTFNIDSLVKRFHDFLSMPVWAERRMYEGPCLFIGGQLSEYLPADDLTHIRDMFPKAVIRYIPKAGHDLHLQETRLFLELVIKFLKTRQ